MTPSELAARFFAEIEASQLEAAEVLAKLEAIAKGQHQRRNQSITRAYRERRVDDPIWQTFDQEIWPRRWSRGQASHSKFEAFKAWAKLASNEREACLKALSSGRTGLGKVSSPEFLPMLSTWIRRLGWEDEVQDDSPSKSGISQNKQLACRWDQVEEVLTRENASNLDDFKLDRSEGAYAKLLDWEKRLGLRRSDV